MTKVLGVLSALGLVAVAIVMLFGYYMMSAGFKVLSTPDLCETVRCSQ
jgi:hypothetical protein